MNFVSIIFAVFFSLVLLSQLLLRRARARQWALLIASYIFYGWWDWRFCALMLLLTAVAYLAGLAMEKRPRCRTILAVGVGVPLAVLFYFKYTNFFLDSFCALFHIEHGALDIILPVGISFYTFQSLSYTIDVYRGTLPTCHDPMKFALYIAFFPQLVAGPIVKAAEFLPQLEEERRPSRARIARGLTEMLFGVLKKAVLADNLSVFVDAVFAGVGAYSSGTVALAVVAYSLQIYFDFAGYSDMAIGAARCLGYDLAPNFDLPYLSRNVTEFWKRWHISLSTWLMQYLYIPLGGNRRGRWRTYINLMVTMLLGGLWHGANVTFVLWGGLHGLGLCVQKAWSRRFPPKPGAARTAVATVLTALYAMLLWVPFRAQSIDHALMVYRKLFFWTPGVVDISSWTLVALAVLTVATLWCALRCRDEAGRIHGRTPALRLGTFGGTLAFTLLAGMALVLMYTGENPFIYFQF